MKAPSTIFTTLVAALLVAGHSQQVSAQSFDGNVSGVERCVPVEDTARSLLGSQGASDDAPTRNTGACVH